MRTAPAAEILLGWERSLDQPPWQRALTLLALGYPEATLTTLANLNVIERDARLVQMRAEMFGSPIEGLVDCPGCGQCVEFNLDSTALHSNRDAGGGEHDQASGPTAQPESSIAEHHVSERSVGLSSRMVVNYGDFVLHCRFPTTLDVATISSSADGRRGREQLLERCLLHAERGGRRLSAAELPGEAIDAISGQLSQAQPTADPCFALKCPQCGHPWQTAFDIGAFFWSELNAWAHRLLLEIHLLASAYGWTEDQILGLSPRRRRAYLDFLRA